MAGNQHCNKFQKRMMSNVKEWQKNLKCEHVQVIRGELCRP
jgi:hypothetical protein